MLDKTQHPKIDPYATVKQALTGYLADKLDQPTSGLTSDQLIETLNTIQLNPQLTARIQALLNQTDAGRFAPIEDKQGTTRALVADARVLIDDLEKFFSKRRM